MAAIIGALRGVLSLDSVAFESGAKRAQATMGTMERKMVRMGDRLQKAGRKAALGLTLPLTAAASVAVKSSLSVIDAQAKMAQSMGTTVQSMQVLERAADLSGVSMGEVSQATLQLTKRLSEVAATGKGAAAKSLKTLHLNAQELQQLPLDERLVAIQDALAKYVPEAERAAVATGLFGTRAGITFTRIDGATLRTAADDVRRFGVAVSEVDAEQIEVTNDAISRLGLVGLGVSNQLTAALAPTLEFVANKAAEAAEWFAGLSDRTKQFIAGAGAFAAAVGPAAIGLGVLVKGVLALRGALLLATGPWGLLAGAVAAAGAMFLNYKSNAEKVEAPLEATKKAQEALSAAMGTFSTTAAPSAGAAAISAANDYYKQADAALAVAEAEIAKNKVAEQFARDAYAKYGREPTMEEEAYLDAKAARLVANRMAAEKALNDAIAARKRTAKEVMGSDVKMSEVQKDLNSKLDVTVGTTDKLGGSLKGVKDDTKGLAESMDGPLSSSIDGVSRAFGDWAANGFRDISSMWDAIKDVSKRAVADLVSLLAKNQLQLMLGVSVTGSAGQATAATLTGGGSGSGLLGSLLGSAGSSLLGGGGLLAGGGGILGGIGSGLGGILSGGGLGASFANLGGLMTGSVGGLGAIGAALPALGVIAGGIALLAKGLSRKYEFSGIRGNFTSGGFDGQGYDFYKGGFLRGDKTEYYPLEAELQAVLDSATTGVVGSIGDMAGAIGLSTRKLKGFVSEYVQVNTNQDAEAIMADLMEALDAAGSEMAALVLGTTKFSRAGESALETLTRLSGGLSAVNDMTDLLGQTAFRVSLRGADMASSLVDAFGSADAMATAAASYFQGFYSESEQSETILRRLRDQFAGLNVAMPESRAGFRSLVESVDLTTDAGRKLYAGLLGLSGAMDEVLPKVSEMTMGMSGLLDDIGGEIGDQIDTARKMAEAAKASAELWYRTANTLRDFKDGLLNAGLSGASTGQNAAALEGRFQAAFEAAKGGDVAAAQSIPELARAYLQAAQAGASSSLEYRRIAAQVQGQVQLIAGIADLTGANDDMLTELYEQQIDVLTSLANFLQLEGLTDEEISKLSDGVQELAKDWDGTVSAFETSLGALEKAITDAEAFSYEDLVGSLDVAVSLSDKGPKWIRDLVGAADKGIRTTLDFIVRRDDLTADMKWMAVNALSEHVTAMDFVLRNDVDAETRRLALVAGSELRRNIKFAVTSGLSKEQMRIALAGNSELSRVVNVALGKSDKKAVQLALQNIGGYAVAVTASLSKGVSDKVRQIVFDGAGNYAVMVEAALTNLKGNARRLLLERQGSYTANITATLAQTLPAWKRRLLINASTSAVRAVTVAMAFKGTVSKAERKLLLEQGTAALRTISAYVNPKGISPREWLFLRQLEAGGKVTRSITGGVSYSKTGAAGDSLFALLTNAGIRRRDIVSAVKAAAMTGKAADLFGLLRRAGIRTRNIRSEVKAAAMTGNAASLFGLLRTAGLRTRNIASAVKASAMQGAGAELFGLLRRPGARLRNVLSGVKLGKMTANETAMFAQLRAGAAPVEKTLRGKVDLSGLTERQKALLDAVRGASNGTLTVGGNFTFTPAQAFRALFEDATAGMTGLKTPISGLTSKLDALRQAVRDDIADRKAAARIATLNTRGVDQLAEINGRKSAAGDVVAKIRALEASTGISLLNGDGAAILKQNKDGTISYKATATTGGAGLAEFQKAFYGPNGLQAQIYAANKAIRAMPEDRKAIRALRAQIRGLGGVPAFANGGAHLGGWRVVGERGWELEHTGPSRVVSHSDAMAQLDNRPVVLAVQRLAQQSAVQGQRLELLMKKMAQITESWDFDGMPEVRS
ncbi:hypothetical protein [Pseudodonghicola flavimaris]|uniref:Phage tail tape measure protein n=1 Tax=Pseudodonghicola flavimaris TaxID=3050036 RepID=A0ABT7EZ66_9RHOB|nr:hypothetical protein [Pseudodonghicola flavimaris]MDK3017628.1 hypothetical protein [Pseudodonghicola flavimaris]